MIRKTSLIVFAALLSACSTASANLFGNILDTITGKNNETGQAVQLPTRHQAYMQALNRSAQQAGYVPQVGTNAIVIVGDPGQVSTNLLDGGVIPVAQKFGIRVLHLSNNGFQNLKYTRNGQDYTGRISNFIVPCNSDLSLCNFNRSFYTDLEDNPQSIAFFVGRNILWNQSIPLQRVLSGLSVIPQPGLDGPNRIYIFFDPDCSTCWHEFHVIQSDLSSIRRKYPKISIEWVPTDIFRANKSAGRAEQCLERGFAAIREDYDHFDLRTETGGLTNIPVASEENAIAYNVAAIWYLSVRYGEGGQPQSRSKVYMATPTFMSVINGTPTVVVGVPSSAFFSEVNSSPAP